MDFKSSLQNDPSEQAMRLHQLLLQEEESKRRRFAESLFERNEQFSTFHIPTANTLEPLLNSQSSVEYQLQQQVNFYQEALSNLQIRSNQITEENAKLYDKMRESIIKEPAFSSDDEKEETEEDESCFQVHHSKTHQRERLMKTKSELQAEREKKHTEASDLEELNFLGFEMDKLKELQHAKTQQLESLLHAARKQVEDKEKVITELKSEMNYYKMPVKEDPNSFMNFHTTKSLPNSIPGTKLVQRLTRECEELSDSLEKQQKLVAAGSQRELQAYEQVKKSCELVEQVQLEKQESMIQVLQLKKDLHDYKDKYANVQRKLQEHQVIYNKRQKDTLQTTLDKLDQKVEDQVLMIAGLENELEKTTRAKVDMKRELDQYQLRMLTKEMETTALIDETRKDTLDAMKNKTLIEQELHQLRLDYRGKDKKRQQEVDHLQIDVKETKRRLQVSDKSVTVLQNDIIQLTNQMNATEQQVHREQLQRQLDQQSFEEQKRKMLLESGKREQELLQLLQQNEERSATNENELTRLLESQAEILQKFKEECSKLKERLQIEQEIHGEKNSQLTTKYKQLQRNAQELVAKSSQKDEQVAELVEQMRFVQEECIDYKEQVVALMSKQNIILRERNLLSKEIEVLKNQLKTSKFQTSS